MVPGRPSRSCFRQPGRSGRAGSSRGSIWGAAGWAAHHAMRRTAGTDL